MTNNFDIFEDVPVTPTKQEETEQKFRELEREQLFIKTLQDVHMANNATSWGRLMFILVTKNIITENDMKFITRTIDEKEWISRRNEE